MLPLSSLTDGSALLTVTFTGSVSACAHPSYFRLIVTLPPLKFSVASLGVSFRVYMPILSGATVISAIAGLMETSQYSAGSPSLMPFSSPACMLILPEVFPDVNFRYR